MQDLIDGIRSRGRLLAELSQEQVLLTVKYSTKQRFELANGRIRALYGHSVEKPIKRKVRTPPELLYHGTHIKALPLIQAEGLRALSRQHVNLTTSPSYALSARTRKSEDPVLFRIQAARASEYGICFYEANDIVWLADFVPPQFLSFLRAESLGTKRPWAPVVHEAG
jgi:putative RNA 2'-phosphotransferase